MPKIKTIKMLKTIQRMVKTLKIKMKKKEIVKERENKKV